MHSAQIQLNNRPYPYSEGATIKSIMAENNYEFSHIIAKINGTVIEEAHWATAKISAGDSVEIIHIFGGG
ncbi:MAG: sulfur carrier protein ThiS [Oscillospiraceae bacterium]|nr:sulfur carrier protein ThiS [Oscillospiraceae bacterium]